MDMFWISTQSSRRSEEEEEETRIDNSNNVYKNREHFQSIVTEISKIFFSFLGLSCLFVFSVWLSCMMHVISSRIWNCQMYLYIAHSIFSLLFFLLCCESCDKIEKYKGVRAGETRTTKSNHEYEKSSAGDMPWSCKNWQQGTISVVCRRRRRIQIHREKERKKTR